MSKCRVVVDTNVYISAALTPHGTANKAITWVLEEGVLFTSNDTFGELESRLWRPRFDRYVTSAGRTAFLDFLAARAVFVEPVSGVQVCSDPDDDKFVALAVAANAAYIITGNAKDFPVSPFNGIQIVNPKTFLDEVCRA